MTTPYTPQQVQMTLAAIAYADDKTFFGIRDYSLAEIGRKIANELQGDHTHMGKPYAYATGKDWRLAWGPVFGTTDDNLMYVAEEIATTNLSIVLRGTVEQVLSFWEDVPTGQLAFGNGAPGDAMVSDHFLEALNGLLATADSSGATLEQYLQNAVSDGRSRTIYVTGHSQGGGLTSMMLAWAANAGKGWSGAGQLAFKGYAFAPPTSGNPAYANWINASFDLVSVVNCLDIVPFGYAAIDRIRPDNVPEPVPHWQGFLDLWAILDVAAGLAADAGQWQQPSNQLKLGPEKLPSTMSYLSQVGGQHNHNSYLYLLGAPQVYNVGTASPLGPPQGNG